MLIKELWQMLALSCSWKSLWPDTRTIMLIKSSGKYSYLKLIKEYLTKYSHYLAHERASHQILALSAHKESWPNTRTTMLIKELWQILVRSCSLKSLWPNTHTKMVIKESLAKYLHNHAHERVSDQILALACSKNSLWLNTRTTMPIKESLAK